MKLDWSLSSHMQRAVALEQRVADGERDVVRAGRDARGALHLVVEVVLAGEARVRVLRGAVDAVVVVPERAGALLVRVLVDLALAGLVTSLA